LERHSSIEIDGVCKTLSFEPLWLLMTKSFNTKNTPPAERFNCSWRS